MLAEGELAPEFEGRTAAGTTLRLSDLRGRTVVLYFYPKAGTLGCTREARQFAEQYSDLRARGAEVIGVSVDDPIALRRFTDDCHLPFPLVADEDRAIARSYGVLGAFDRARRVTFVVDAKGRVLKVIDSLFPGPHVQETSRLLRASP